MTHAPSVTATPSIMAVMAGLIWFQTAVLNTGLQPPEPEAPGPSFPEDEQLLGAGVDLRGVERSGGKENPFLVRAFLQLV